MKKVLYRFCYVTYVMVLMYGCGGPDDIDWATYQGDKGRNQYKAIDQINKENVSQLSVAWEYHTGDGDSLSSQIQCNPLIVDGVFYATTAKLKVIALNAATGELIWQYDPKTAINFGLNANRGVSYFYDGKRGRLFYTAGDLLISLDARTGFPIQSFGINGVVSLKNGLDRDVANLYVASTTPGVIFKDKLIMPTRVSEGPDAAPGHIRAFNVFTGEVEWVFHTIPHPGEFGHDTWPEDGYQKLGGANCWAGMSLDEERGIVYVPTGSASFDFWGGNRKGENLFANSLIALDANSGQRIWHFQTVHHDIWDRDIPAPPNLVTIERDGSKVDAVAQITKSGLVFVFDRQTGEPIFPIEEVPVPASSVPGEEAWPTQPIPTAPPPFARQVFSKDLVTDIDPASHAYVDSILNSIDAHQRFQPLDFEPRVIFPGLDGGGEWGGAAFDPETGVLYVNSNEMAWLLKLAEEDERADADIDIGSLLYNRNCAICHAFDRAGDATGTYPSLIDIGKRIDRDSLDNLLQTGRGFMPSFAHIDDERRRAIIDFLLEIEGNDYEINIEKPAVPYFMTGYNRFFDKNGYPAVKPPWGQLNAIDLNEGKILWQVPLGEFEELTNRGIPKTGTENYGGPVVTSGGLIFIGATQDEYFRVFDKETGDELWKYKLPAGGYATPSTYTVNGKQYVVIAAGGGKMGTKGGDSYVAFALRD